MSLQSDTRPRPASNGIALYKRNIIQVVILLIALFGVLSFTVPKESYQETQTIGRGVLTFKELSDRFVLLANKKGAVYAFEVLKRADMPKGTDMHLLGHVVGDELYKQKGVGGIADCTQDFRNACSHTIVIGALNEFGGEKALSLIRDACQEAPGGSGAYTMCYHGLGHGVFAYFEYDLEKTVLFCRKTGTSLFQEREYTECVSGAIMELMGGGGHDHDLWLLAREKYLSDTDPLAPCSRSAIPRDAKGMCYTYLTPHLFEFAGADLSMPKPEHFVTAFSYCDRVSSETPDLRQSCFSGIGKEFPVLAMARDIRAIDKANDSELNIMRNWCALAPHDEAYDACTRSVLESLFWGGENDPVASIRFCSLSSAEEQEKCFETLFDEANHYLNPKGEERRNICALVPADFSLACQNGLSI